MIQENKKEIVDSKLLRFLWGIYNCEWTSIPSIGAAGGLMIAWKTDFFSLVSREHGSSSLSMKLKGILDRQLWWITCIYGPPSNRGKSDFWIELNDIGNLVDGPWCIGGDFSDILYPSDRKAP